MPYRGLPSSLPGARPQGELPGATALELEFACLSDPGRVRGHNEDFVGYVEPATSEDARQRGWLFAVADGVGGQECGEVASRTAVEALTAGFGTGAAGEQPSALLARLVQAANIKVYEAGRAAAPGGVAMATTLVACTLRYDKVVVAHVGDSRCYLIRRGHAMALTRDHTVVNEQVRLGMMSAREAAKSETRHVLSRSLGMELFVSVDLSEHRLMKDDVLLLCSDGLHGAVPAQEISRAAPHGRAVAAAVRELVDLANSRDGSDNVSVMLIRIINVERVGMYRGRPYKLR